METKYQPSAAVFEKQYMGRFHQPEDYEYMSIDELRRAAALPPMPRPPHMKTWIEAARDAENAEKEERRRKQEELLQNLAADHAVANFREAEAAEKAAEEERKARIAEENVQKTDWDLF